MLLRVGGEASTDRRERATDAAVVVVLLALSLALVAGVVDGVGNQARASIVVAAHVLPLAGRRRWPVSVAVAMAATALLSVPLGVPMVVLGPASAVIAYTLGALVPESLGRRVLIGLLLVMAVVVVANDGDGGSVVSNAIVLGISWWLGRRSRAAAEQVQAERAATATVAERAVVEERLRIARELHDVVAHAMSVIAVQAGTGRYVIDRSPDVAAAALRTIEEVSRDALDELRRLLAVLRDDGPDPDGLCPAPGLEDIPALVTATSAAGVAVDLEVVGTPVLVPPGVALCAYRIIQEALTNVRKHARATTASVALIYEPGSLEILIADNGVGSSSTARGSGGMGLAGMRERAELYGGTLTVERDRGCRVRAQLPLDAGTR